MKTEFEIKLLALTLDAQEAIQTFIKKQDSVELFTMEDIVEIDDPKIDIFAYPDFPYYDTENGIEYAAIQSIRQEGENIYIKGVLKGDSFPETVEVHLFDLDAASSTALADHLYHRFVGE